MSGVHGQVLGHLVRRGYHAAHAQLQSDAQAYDKAGPDMQVQAAQLLPVIITAVLILLVVSTIDYTLGDLMAALTMIESRTATAVVDDKPPAYADEPDAPLEKEPLMPTEAVADLELTVVPNKPITAKITTTMRHLKQIGGFRAKWRGIRISALYHVCHATVTNTFSTLLGLGVVGQALVYIFSSVCLARLHAVWTHSMIAYPSNKPFWQRILPRKQCKALLLPSLVFALAQQATYILPLAVAIAVGLPDVGKEHVAQAANHENCGQILLLALRLLAVPATGLFVAFAILLPATVTLTRIEALLLPESEDTIVPFDRQAIMGDIDLTARNAPRLLFVSAWRSFDRASRWRLIKLYVKMVMIQVGVVFAGIHVMAAEIYLIGGEKLGLLFKSAAAQFKLMAIEAQENAQ